MIDLKAGGTRSRVSIYPQDPMISKPESLELPSSELGKQLQGTRLTTVDTVALAQADAQGNYNPAPGTPQFDQVNAHAVVASTVATYEKYMGHALKWASAGPLTVRPHAGEGKTAFYSRKDNSLNFKQWTSPSLGKTVTTSQSFDAISHETGHAILDGLRPNLRSGSEGQAFHEGFGDSSAMLHALQFDSNLEKILAENGGDFRKPNLLSRLCEEFGTAVNKEDSDPNNDDHPYYRSSLNDFQYCDPAQLPGDTYPPQKPESVLTSEPHSFSRIWSGLFYSLVGSVFQQCSREGTSQLDALRKTRDILGTVWGRSLDQLPASNVKFRQPAQAILREASNLEGGKYFDSLARAMLDRKVLTPQEVQQAHTKAPQLRLEHPLENAAQAQAWLQAQPTWKGQDWKADAPRPGSQGRQVLTFRSPQEIEVNLGDLGAARQRLDSGLTLVFDAQGQLLHQVATPVQSQDVQQARLLAHQLSESGKITQQDLTHSKGALPLLELPPTWD